MCNLVLNVRTVDRGFYHPLQDYRCVVNPLNLKVNVWLYFIYSLHPVYFYLVIYYSFIKRTFFFKTTQN